MNAFARAATAVPADPEVDYATRAQMLPSIAPQSGFLNLIWSEIWSFSFF